MGALIYLHPADPISPFPVLAGHKSLKRATWEWGVETGSHALRIAYMLDDQSIKWRVSLCHLEGAHYLARSR